jgi:hypothetical protein
MKWSIISRSFIIQEKTVCTQEGIDYNSFGSCTRFSAEQDVIIEHTPGCGQPGLIHAALPR